MKFNALALAYATLLPSALAAGDNSKKLTPVPAHYAKSWSTVPRAGIAPAPAAAGVAANPPRGSNQNEKKNNNKKQKKKQKKIEAFDGRAERTKDGHKGAVKKWNQFASINKYPSFHRLTKQQVCGQVYANGSMANPENPPLREMLAEFAQYLIEYKKSGKEDEEEEAEILARKGDDEDDDDDEEEEEIQTAREPYNGLKPKVILQYFTTMKAMFFQRFEALAFKGPSPKWYLSLHASLKLRVAADCLVRGGKMTKKAVGFGREVLIEICDYLMKQEDQALGCEERCILALLYAAVGRGGEVSYATWNSARWDKAREHLAFDWGEKKKGVQYLMTFHPDSTEWRVDVIHALACYVLCRQGGGSAPASPQESGVHWLFASYVVMAEGGAANKVSRILEKCRNGGVAGVPDGSNSHGVRVGATDEMIFNHMLSVFAAIARGGWDFKADSMLFYYFTQEVHVGQGGKALANWSNPNMHVSAPTLKAITDDNNDVERFCQALFTSVDIPG